MANNFIIDGKNIRSKESYINLVIHNSKPFHQLIFDCRNKESEVDLFLKQIINNNLVGLSTRLILFNNLPNNLESIERFYEICTGFKIPSEFQAKPYDVNPCIVLVFSGESEFINEYGWGDPSQVRRFNHIRIN